MKESISATALFQIVILFILLFTAIMCLTINNANAFAVKDEIINIIELSHGKFLEDGRLSEEIQEAINQAQYRTTGYCDTDAGFVGYRKDGEPVGSREKASICIKDVHVTSELEDYLADHLGSENVPSNEFLDGHYYQLIVFYQLDLPVMNKVYSLNSKGETKILYQDSGGNSWPIR